MFKETRYNVVMRSNSGKSVHDVYHFENEFYAKIGGKYKRLRPNNMVDFNSTSLRWHVIYNKSTENPVQFNRLTPTKEKSND